MRILGVLKEREWTISENIAKNFPVLTTDIEVAIHEIPSARQDTTTETSHWHRAINLVPNRQGNVLKSAYAKKYFPKSKYETDGPVSRSTTEMKRQQSSIPEVLEEEKLPSESMKLKVIDQSKKENQEK